MRCSQKTCPALCLLKPSCQPGEPKLFVFHHTDLLLAVAAAASKCAVKLQCRPTTYASRLSSLQEAARQGHCEITLPDPLPDCLDFEVLTLVGLPGALLFYHSKPLSCGLPVITLCAALLRISRLCRIAMHAACLQFTSF